MAVQSSTDVIARHICYICCPKIFDIPVSGVIKVASEEIVWIGAAVVHVIGLYIAMTVESRVGRHIVVFQQYLLKLF